MAPKRSAAKRKDSDYEDDFVDDSDFEVEEEEEVKPKKKAPAKKKAATEGADGKPAKGGKGGKKKEEKKVYAKITEPTEIEPDAWTAHPPSLLYKDRDSLKSSSKVAAFDFDGTLALTKSGAEFPTGASDWRFYNEEVPKKLQAYHEQGYRIAIFSNQGSVKSALNGLASDRVRGRISNLLIEAGVPFVALIATQKDELRKPSAGMWHWLCERLSPEAKPDPSLSFFVGDASSPSNEKVGDSDKQFAAAVGLQYRDVKQEFGEPMELPAPPAAAAAAEENRDIINIFERLKQTVAGDRMKMSAYGKIVAALGQFPKKITDDKETLQELNSMAGIGKGTMDKVKEYLATGQVTALAALPADKMEQPTGPSKQQIEAQQFM